uniref:Gamma-soluble NSF attachment protein n=1 Tax=Steinernema glaseri TaxID=37863 RepID=A0A1I8AL01_9BILA
MDTAAMSIDKAAKWMEAGDPEKAIYLYKKGLAFVQQSDRSRMAGDFLTRITKLNLKLERYDEAAESVRDEIEKYKEVNEAGRAGQLTTGLVLILLAKGDAVAATKAYGEATKLSGFERSEDGLACASLISAYQSNDNDLFQECLRRPTLRSMDNEYLRLMKKLKIEDEFSNMNISADRDVVEVAEIEDTSDELLEQKQQAVPPAPQDESEDEDDLK